MLGRRGAASQAVRYRESGSATTPARRLRTRTGPAARRKLPGPSRANPGGHRISPQTVSLWPGRLVLDRRGPWYLPGAGWPSGALGRYPCSASNWW